VGGLPLGRWMGIARRHALPRVNGGQLRVVSATTGDWQQALLSDWRRSRRTCNPSPVALRRTDAHRLTIESRNSARSPNLTLAFLVVCVVLRLDKTGTENIRDVDDPVTSSQKSSGPDNQHPVGNAGVKAGTTGGEGWLALDVHFRSRARNTGISIVNPREMPVRSEFGCAPWLTSANIAAFFSVI